MNEVRVRDLETLANEARLARTHGRPLPSPCVNVCRIDEQAGWCEGCFRLRDELSGWGLRSEDAKWALWLKIEQRRSGAR